jgi:hypothetical protein
LVVPSPFTPKDVSRRTPSVLAGALAGVVAAGALAAGVELAPLEDEAPPGCRLRFATASGLAGSLPPPPHAASTSAPLPANSDVRN